MSDLSLKCPLCLAEALIVRSSGSACTFCGYKEKGKKAALDFIEKSTGKGAKVYECPDCTEEALVDLRSAGELMDSPAIVCFNCGGTWGREELELCPECRKMRPGSGFEELIICRSAVGFYVCGECYLRIFK